MLNLPTSCNPQRCKVEHLCPYDSPQTCKFEEDFMTVAKEWTNQLPKSPLAELQITTLLMPLLKQYLRLSLAQESTEEPIKDLTVVIKTISKITRSINAHEKGTTL